MAQVATDFGLSVSCLKRWLVIDERNSTRGSAPARCRAESEGLREANKRIRLLEQENEVLRRAGRADPLRAPTTSEVLTEPPAYPLDPAQGRS
jgi:hypothetical protein